MLACEGRRDLKDLNGSHGNLVALQSKRHQSFLDAEAESTAFPCDSEGERCLSNGLKASAQSQLVQRLLIPVKEIAGNNYCYF